MTPYIVSNEKTLKNINLNRDSVLYFNNQCWNMTHLYSQAHLHGLTTYRRYFMQFYQPANDGLMTIVSDPYGLTVTIAGPNEVKTYSACKLTAIGEILARFQVRVNSSTAHRMHFDKDTGQIYHKEYVTEENNRPLKKDDLVHYLARNWKVIHISELGSIMFASITPSDDIRNDEIFIRVNNTSQASAMGIVFKD